MHVYTSTLRSHELLYVVKLHARNNTNARARTYTHAQLQTYVKNPTYNIYKLSLDRKSASYELNTNIICMVNCSN